MPTEILESPRIALLREALENGHHEVLEVFWREVEAQGTLGAVHVFVLARLVGAGSTSIVGQSKSRIDTFSRYMAASKSDILPDTLETEVRNRVWKIKSAELPKNFCRLKNARDWLVCVASSRATKI
ncbi:MAG: hypothetical protein ABI234_12520 [Ktedonobacteraceae bacterium]